MITSLQHVGLGVTDAAASYDFYKKVLGFPVKISDYVGASKEDGKSSPSSVSAGVHALPRRTSPARAAGGRKAAQRRRRGERVKPLSKRVLPELLGEKSAAVI